MSYCINNKAFQSTNHEIKQQLCERVKIRTIYIPVVKLEINKIKEDQATVIRYSDKLKTGKRNKEKHHSASLYAIEICSMQPLTQQVAT